MRTRLFCLWLVLMLLCPGAYALEVSGEDVDYWYEEMTWLVDDVGTRKVGTTGEKAGYEYMVQAFGKLGYSFEKGNLFLSLSHVEGWSEEDSISLIAVKPAVNPNAKIITVCAHYDSLSPGARDNASGVAAMLLMCKLFTAQPALPDTEMRFIAFSAEESGHQGSIAYCEELTADERARSLATFNIDILVTDVWEENRAFSMDTMGMRTEEGYVDGSEEQPAYNVPALALLQARTELEVYPDDEEDWTWCLPRHLGMSDHESFHGVQIDSVNVCFRGNSEGHGRWPEFMHTPSDVMGDFDLNTSWTALNVLYTAVDGLARDHTYGQ